MLHTSILAYANRNRILVRLVASFPLLFTTSDDVLCSKFSGVWEMLWIFKVARWTHNRCTKINKSPTVSNGIGASSFEIWTGDCSHLPCRNPKTWHSDADISDLGFIFYAFIFDLKNQNMLDIQEHSIRKLGKIQSERKLLFGVYYWFFLSCILGSFDTVTSLCMGFHSERAAAGLGPSGFKYWPSEVLNWWTT